MFDKDLFLSLCNKYDVKFSETVKEPIMCENNKKLVQHIRMNIPGIPKQGMYCYGEASLETNMEMQEPLEKLYKYENQPDVREKVKEYISELNMEIKRCMDWQDDHYDKLGSLEFEKMCSRVMTLQEVRNDLKGRLEELV